MPPGFEEPVPSADDLEIQGLPYVLVTRTGAAITRLEAHAGTVSAVPLFYTVDGNSLALTDDPRRLLRCAPPQGIDGQAVLELAAFGYVLGSKTLVEGVKQLPAETALRLDGGGVRHVQASRSLSGAATPLGADDVARRMEGAADRVFGELLQRAGSSRLVVPLSGGYDSRFIAGMLKKLGARRVLCVSYGYRGNTDSETSRWVARRLGYPWVMADYSARKWREVFAEDAFWDCVRQCSFLSSAFSFQEYPLVKWVKAVTGCGPEESVFIPGHAVFTVVPHAGDELNDEKAVVDAILRRHYTLRADPVNSLVRRAVVGWVSEAAAASGGVEGLYEEWNRRERQAKPLIRACAVYDAFGFRWAAPLWDRRFVDIWCAMPPALRAERAAYRQFLHDRLFRPLGIDMPAPRAASPISHPADWSAASWIKDWARRTPSALALYRRLKNVGLLGPRNTCDLDRAGPDLRLATLRRLGSAGRQVEHELKAAFPRGRFLDANSYTAEAVLSCVTAFVRSADRTSHPGVPES